MLGTPIWPNMRVPGPRLKNPSAIPGLSEIWNRMRSESQKVDQANGSLLEYKNFF